MKYLRLCVPLVIVMSQAFCAPGDRAATKKSVQRHAAMVRRVREINASALEKAPANAVLRQAVEDVNKLLEESDKRAKKWEKAKPDYVINEAEGDASRLLLEVDAQIEIQGGDPKEQLLSPIQRKVAEDVWAYHQALRTEINKHLEGLQEILRNWNSKEVK